MIINATLTIRCSTIIGGTGLALEKYRELTDGSRQAPAKQARQEQVAWDQYLRVEARCASM